LSRKNADVVCGRAPAAGAEALHRHWIEGTHGDQDITGGSIIGIQGLLGEILKKTIRKSE